MLESTTRTAKCQDFCLAHAFYFLPFYHFGEPIDVVDVFRRPEHTPEVARQAVAAGARALWLQLGVANAEARSIAEAAGLRYVEDRCVKVDHAHLLGAAR